MCCDAKRLWDEVNTAISELLTIGPVGNWHYAERLHQKYAGQTEEIILSILDRMRLLQPNREQENYEEFLTRCAKTIGETYPQLSPEAVRVLVNGIAYDWK